MKLEFEDFKGWLGSHLDSEVVGTTCSASSCPISTYLSEKTDGQQWLVGLSSYLPLLQTQSEQKLSEWALLFREKIDATGKGLSEVTAQTAYEILRSIRPWKREYLKHDPDFLGVLP